MIIIGKTNNVCSQVKTEVMEYIEIIQKVQSNYEVIEILFECNINFNLFDMNLPNSPYCTFFQFYKQKYSNVKFTPKYKKPKSE